MSHEQSFDNSGHPQPATIVLEDLPLATPAEEELLRRARALMAKPDPARPLDELPEELDDDAYRLVESGQANAHIARYGKYGRRAA